MADEQANCHAKGIKTAFLSKRNPFRYRSQNLNVEFTHHCFCVQAHIHCESHPVYKKEVINIVLILDFHKRNVVIVGDYFVVHSTLWRFVSGSY
jgi:hypothetical protein